MQRRQFLIFSASAVAFSGMAGALVKGFSASNSYMHICTIQIQLPRGIEISQFLEDRKKWMQVDHFARIVNEFEEKGLLVKKQRTFFDSKITISYFFKDIQSHDYFVKTIDATNTVNDARLEKIGYRFSRKYSRA